MALFTTATASASGRAGGIASGKTRGANPNRLPVRTQIIALQDLALAHAQSKDTPVAICAALMRAYVDLHELRMAVEGTGKPKPVEARNAQPRQKPRKPVQPLGPAKRVAPPAPQAPAPLSPATEEK